MKISEKIYLLRKQNNFTQEKLAELCYVSRQAVSKWESGQITPDIDKIILLSRIFKISTDILLKDELFVDCKVTKQSCHCNLISKDNISQCYEGILIKESIGDESIIDDIHINKVELWKTDSVPNYWTAIYFSSNRDNFPKMLSKSILDTYNWYCDFKRGNKKYIVFHNCVLKYQLGNEKERQFVIEKCKKYGIPDNQLNWQE